MAGLRSGLLLFLLQGLVVLLTGQFGDQKSCKKPIQKQKCGTHAAVQCSANNNITNVIVWRFDTDTFNGNTSLNMKYPTSKDGRLHLTWSGSTATLHINHVKHSDAGRYHFYLKTDNDSGYPYEAEVQMEESSEIPTIFVERMDMKIVCWARGGCPVETIQWTDGNGTNWTNSATSEEKDGVFTSTLLLQKSSIMAEYHCTVTYRHLDKTETQTRCISTGKETQCNEQQALVAGDSEKVMNSWYILVPVAILICAILAHVIYSRRCRARQANNLLDQRPPVTSLVMNDIEMAADTQSSEEDRLHSSPST